MQTKFINCPKCGKPLEYWTVADFIECTGCRVQVQVEPCEVEEKEEGTPEEIDIVEIDI